jgi:hypothetical protein
VVYHVAIRVPPEAAFSHHFLVHQSGLEADPFSGGVPEVTTNRSRIPPFTREAYGARLTGFLFAG